MKCTVSFRGIAEKASNSNSTMLLIQSPLLALEELAWIKRQTTSLSERELGRKRGKKKEKREKHQEVHDPSSIFMLHLIYISLPHR